MKSANRFEITAHITELEPLRYTPSGVPALNGYIEHESQAQEAGHERQVRTMVRFVAMGAVAERLASQPVGSMWFFSGFMASPKGKKSLVFHIQDLVKH